MYNTTFESLVGQTITKIEGAEEGSESITFYTHSGNIYQMYHCQDCCEQVYLEDVCGDINDLLNSTILKASEDTNQDDPPAEGSDESYTWTFYNIATFNGHVTFRWFGSSNGYYSEAVDFVKMN